MKNRRQCTRHELLIRFPVTNVRTGKRCGYLLDIAPEGFQLLSEAPFIEHDVVHVRVEGTFGESHAKEIVLDGICRWCRPDVNKKLWRAGFQISDECSRRTERIIQLICLHGI